MYLLVQKSNGNPPEKEDPLPIIWNYLTGPKQPEIPNFEIDDIKNLWNEWKIDIQLPFSCTHLPD